MGGAYSIGWFSGQAAHHLVPWNDRVLGEAVSRHDPGNMRWPCEAAGWRLGWPEEGIGIEALLIVALHVRGLVRVAQDGDARERT